MQTGVQEELSCCQNRRVIKCYKLVLTNAYVVLHSGKRQLVPAGKLCIEVAPTSKVSWISEELCIGCGICVKVCCSQAMYLHCLRHAVYTKHSLILPSVYQKCPFDAIMIINLPKNLEKETTHRYSANSFKLHRLPVPRPGQVYIYTVCLSCNL